MNCFPYSERVTRCARRMKEAGLDGQLIRAIKLEDITKK